MKRLAAIALPASVVFACAVGAQQPAVNARDFGVRCDGFVDDTQNIQRALESGAKTVRAPSGVCRISTLSIPSNVELAGEGWSTVFFLNDGVSGPALLVPAGHSGVQLRDFKISANSKSQTADGRSSGIFVHQNARRVHIENVWVDDVTDWGFHINGSEVTVRRTKATNITGARGEDAVRAGYLIGSGVPPVEASRVTIDDAEVAECGLPHTDGFILERGTQIVLQRSRATACAWTCFKVKTNQTLVSKNRATACGVGFQTQGPLQDLTLTDNLSSNNRGSGYQFNQVNRAQAARNWRIANNQARNNGQPPGNSTTYGFAFENVPAAITDVVLILANHAIDDQQFRTQMRGISFGNNGRYTNVHMSGNVATGNKVDYFLGPSVDLNSFSEGQGNAGTGGLPLTGK
jgi:nitrous oxidase accessory protein NosD